MSVISAAKDAYKHEENQKMEALRRVLINTFNASETELVLDRDAGGYVIDDKLLALPSNIGVYFIGLGETRSFNLGSARTLTELGELLEVHGF